MGEWHRGCSGWPKSYHLRKGGSVSRKRHAIPALLGLVVALLSGCATGRGAGAEGTNTVDVQVVNNLDQTMEVWIVDRQGNRHLLGTASASQRSHFPFNEDIVAGPYNLVADVKPPTVPPGNERPSAIESTTFDLSPGSLVIWDMETNTIRVVPAGERSGNPVDS